MKNSFKSVDKAIQSFKTHKAWTVERTYYTNFNSVVVCLDKEDVKKGYFLIFHPMCVKYREELGQVVKRIV